MVESSREPTLHGLLNQFEDIGGPEEYGPEGVAIMVALWRKSSKLGWKQDFQMTNTELTLQTGIKSRDTINTHRNRLVNAGLIHYSPPPRGSSRGEYRVQFDLVDTGEPDQRTEDVVGKVVRKLDNFTKVVGEVVQNPDHFGGEEGEVVRKLDHFPDTVLKDFKDTITTNTDKGPDDPFEILFGEFCVLHGKIDTQVKKTDVTLMQWMITQGIPVPLIIKVMKQLFTERTAKGTTISTFVYYKNAILQAWETVTAITDRVPIPAVALGVDTITDGVPAPTVALGSSPKRDTRSRYQREMDELKKEIEEGRRHEQTGSG